MSDPTPPTPPSPSTPSTPPAPPAPPAGTPPAASGSIWDQIDPAHRSAVPPATGGEGYNWDTDPAGIGKDLGEARLAGKFKSVSELEKGYKSLESRLGSQGSVPQEYDFGQAKDALGDQAVTEMTKAWREAGVSQAAATAFLGMLMPLLAPPTMDEILGEVGQVWKADRPTALTRLAALDAWGRSLFGPDWDTMRGKPQFQSPQAIVALDEMRQRANGKRLWSPDGESTPTVYTKSELDAMNARLARMDATDPERKPLMEKITKGFEALYGTAPVAGVRA